MDGPKEVKKGLCHTVSLQDVVFKVTAVVVVKWMKRISLCVTETVSGRWQQVNGMIEMNGKFEGSCLGEVAYATIGNVKEEFRNVPVPYGGASGGLPNLDILYASRTTTFKLSQLILT